MAVGAAIVGVGAIVAEKTAEDTVEATEKVTKDTVEDGAKVATEAEIITTGQDSEKEVKVDENVKTPE